MGDRVKRPAGSATGAPRPQTAPEASPPYAGHPSLGGTRTSPVHRDPDRRKFERKSSGSTPRPTMHSRARSAGHGWKSRPSGVFLTARLPDFRTGFPISGDSRERAAIGASADSGNPRLGRSKHKHGAVIEFG